MARHRCREELRRHWGKLHAAALTALEGVELFRVLPSREAHHLRLHAFYKLRPHALYTQGWGQVFIQH